MPQCVLRRVVLSARSMRGCWSVSSGHSGVSRGRGRPSGHGPAVGGHGPAVGPLGRFESKGRVKLPKKLDSNNVVIIHGIQTAAQGFDVYYHS